MKTYPLVKNEAAEEKLAQLYYVVGEWLEEHPMCL